MSKRKIEAVINDVLRSEAQKSALDLIAHLRAEEEHGIFKISINDEKDESGWSVSNLGFILISGDDDFPGPWTMWVGADNMGEHYELAVDAHIKKFAWSHVAPCGSCGGTCSPGTRTRVFGKDFENVCQHNLMFTNPNTEAVTCIKKIIDIRKNEIARNN